ncbi:MAG: polyamine ABC transporter permease [Epulopiscium sp. Nele67-Bin002]|nr:MAG: polyamine ABC transporter permease [Epulopiscium sp. Nele67-Bin002]OON92770.1 MAG: polyamine ABC transporter permease [Epulopiscium sp. Nele67-Bin001]
MIKLYACILIFIMIFPAIIIIPQAFTSVNYFKYPIEEFSLKWFEKFFANSEWVVGLQRSIGIALVSAIIATILGTMAAVAVNKFNFKGKSLFMSIMIAPMVVPVIVVGVSLYNSFAVVGLTNSFIGIIFAHVLLGIPMVFVTMLSGLANVDENLELAAMSMSATPLKTFFTITLPTVRSSLVSSMLFTFVTSLDEVVVTTFVSGANTKTLTMVMWENIRTNIDPSLAVAAIFMIILTLSMYIIKEIIEIRTENR